MKNFQLVSLLLVIFGCCCSAKMTNLFDDASDAVKDIVKPLTEKYLKPMKQKYNDLPDRGKFVSGALTGFVASRIIVVPTVKIGKALGATFIVAEIMNSAGFLDDRKYVSEDQQVFFNRAKQQFVEKVNAGRIIIRENISINKLRSSFANAMEQDKMTTVGLTSGAVAALIL